MQLTNIRYFQTVKFHPSLETSASSHRRFEAVFRQIFFFTTKLQKAASDYLTLDKPPPVGEPNDL